MAASSQSATTLQPASVEQIARQATGAVDQSLLQVQQQVAPPQYLLTTNATAASSASEYPLHQQQQQPQQINHHHQPDQISTSRLGNYQQAPAADMALTSALPSNSFARYALSQTPLVQLELELAQQEQQPAQYAVEGQLLAFAGHQHHHQQQHEHLAQQQQQVIQQQHYLPPTSLAPAGVIVAAPPYLPGSAKDLIQQPPVQMARNKLAEPSPANSSQLAAGPQQIILVAHNANQLSG